MRVRGLLCVLLLALGPSCAQPRASIEGLHRVFRVPYTGGSRLAFDGRYVYAGQFNGTTRHYQSPDNGGVRIVDSTTTPPTVVATIDCPGFDNDVAVIRPGLLALGYSVSTCGPGGDGVTFYDVTDAAHPRKAGTVKIEQQHTITPLPGTPYLFVSPGGVVVKDPESGRQVGTPNETVIDVTDAAAPRVVATFPARQNGCHDVAFARVSSGLVGLCSGGDGVELWDMADPLRPKVIGSLDDPDVSFAHGVAVSDDGSLLVLNDQSHEEHTCDGRSRAGAIGLYDITDVAHPRKIGHFSPPRGRRHKAKFLDGTAAWCASHQVFFVPGEKRLVVTWYSGGTSLLDVSDPAAPREVAHYREPDSIAWTAQWYAGRIWVNDMSRGLEVLEPV
jgi:hypothetical protein